MNSFKKSNKVRNVSRIIVQLSLLAFVVVFGMGCDKDDDNNNSVSPSTTEMAELRVAHLVPDAPAVDVYVDGEMALSSVGFGAVSAYLEVEAGMRQVEVYASGTTSNPVIDAEVTLGDNNSYTVAAMGQLSNSTIAPTVSMDSRGAPSNGSWLRFVHASPDAPAVDVKLADGTMLFSNSSFRDVEDYLPVDAGMYDIRVTLAGTDDVVLSYDNIEIPNQSILTVWAIGALGNETNPLNAAVTVEAPGNGAGATPLEPVVEYASVRVAHLSPNAPEVDVYVDDMMVLEDVAYLGISGYLEVEAGEHQVRVFAANTTSNPVIDAMLTFEAENSYTVAARGLLGEDTFGATVTMDERMTGGSLLRFVHTSADAPAVDITLTDGTVLFGNVAFGEADNFIDVAAGSYDVQVRVAGTETVAISFADLPVNMGDVLTVWAVGLLNPGGDGQELKAAVTLDAAGDGSSVLLVEGATSMVRVGHLSPDAPAVDVIVNGATVLENVSFPAVSGYLTVPAATNQVLVVTSDGQATVFDVPLTTLPGEAYTVAARNFLDDIQLSVLMDDMMTGSGAKVRFVHFSPDAPEVDIVVADGGPVLFSMIDYLEIGGYLEVAGGSYDLEVQVSENGAVALSLDGVMFSDGMNYTVFATGSVNDGTLGALLASDEQQ